MKYTLLFFIFSTLILSCSTQKKEEVKTNTLIIEQEEGKDIAKKYYTDGIKQTEGEVKDSTIRNGNWKYWYENGVLWSECEYTEGIKDGKTKVYYQSGSLKYEGQYKNDIAIGKWIFYNEDGSIQKEVSHE